jgi:hypothetical protein
MYQKIKSKKCKIWISTSGLTHSELRWAFVPIVLCCFFLCDLLCLPSAVSSWEEAQIRHLRHLTKCPDGALNFVLKLWNFYRPLLLSNWAENWCASCLSDTESEKVSKNKSKIYKIWISTSALTPWWAPLSFRADRVVVFLSLWSDVPS